MRFHLDSVSGEPVCFDGQLAAQATALNPNGADSILIARVFRTVGGQWVVQLEFRSWRRGDVSATLAWPATTAGLARRDLAHALRSSPELARTLFQRLGWDAGRDTEGRLEAWPLQY